MRINHNIPALRALYQLNSTNSDLDKTLERLSSGLRINRAADDAAGLAITQKMDTQIRGLEQAERNAMDGISLIQTAEGALSEVHAMLQRINELAIQVSNGTYDAEDRQSVQSEVDELLEEIERISSDVEFNERKLLNGDIDRRAFPDDETVAQMISLSDAVTPGDYTISIVSDATKATITGNAANLPNPTIGQTGTINLNGEEVTIEADDTPEEAFNKLRDLAETVGANLVAYDSFGNAVPFADGTHLVFEMEQYGSDYSLVLNTTNTTLLADLGLDVTPTAGQDVVATLGAGFSSTATVSTSGNTITVTDIDDFEMKMESQDGAAGNSTTITVLDSGPLTLQIGANEGQTMEVRIQNISPKAIGIDAINLSTVEGAQLASTAVKSAINLISSVRAKLGAYQNRLEYTVSNLGVATENMTESMSRILDADMAYEMAQYTQQNVLSQAGTSMLAQANQRPQSILQLLQS